MMIVTIIHIDIVYFVCLSDEFLSVLANRYLLPVIVIDYYHGWCKMVKGRPTMFVACSRLFSFFFCWPNVTIETKVVQSKSVAFVREYLLAEAGFRWPEKYTGRRLELCACSRRVMHARAFTYFRSSFPGRTGVHACIIQFSMFLLDVQGDLNRCSIHLQNNGTVILFMMNLEETHSDSWTKNRCFISNKYLFLGGSQCEVSPCWRERCHRIKFTSQWPVIVNRAPPAIVNMIREEFLMCRQRLNCHSLPQAIPPTSHCRSSKFDSWKMESLFVLRLAMCVFDESVQPNPVCQNNWLYVQNLQATEERRW